MRHPGKTGHLDSWRRSARWTAGAAATVLWAVPAQAQVQANGPEASLLVDGRSGDGYEATPVMEWVPGHALVFELAGEALQPVALLHGLPVQPGFVIGAPGVLNLLPIVPVFNGFEPSGFLFHTGPDGRFVLGIGADLPFGTEVDLQGVVGSASGPRLTAPQRLRSAPVRIAYRDFQDLRGTNAFGSSDMALFDGHVSRFAFSPDGERIALLSNQGLVMIDAVGASANHPVLVLPVASNIVEGPRWNATSDRVAFLTRPNPGADTLYVAHRDGSGLTALPIPDVQDFAWSPDGTKLAFRWSPLGIFGTTGLWVTDKDGGGITPVSSFVPTVDVGFVWSWSPDSQHLSFYDDTVFRHRLYCVRADGQVGRHLSSDVDRSAWAPDGSRLAYSIDPVLGTDSGDLYSVKPDGTAVLRLNATPTPGVLPRVSDLRWSPQRSHVAYVSNEGGDGRQLWVVRADGSNATRHPVSAAVNPGKDISRFAWSPDESTLAFQFEAHPSLYTADTNGGDPVLVSASAAPGLFSLPLAESVLFRWNPDPSRRTLAYLANEDATIPGYEVYAVETDGSDPPRRMSGSLSFPALEGDTDFRWDPTGRWLGLGPDMLHVAGAEGGLPLLIGTEGEDDWTWSPAPAPLDVIR